MRAKCAQYDEEYAYRAYVTDTLRMRGEGMYPEKRWIDIIDPQPVDTRSGDEIALEFAQRMNGGE